MADSPKPRSPPGSGASRDLTDIVILPLACLAILIERPIFVLVLVPIIAVGCGVESVVPLRAQRRRRAGWLTDLYHAVLTRAAALFIAVDLVLTIVAGALDARPGGWLDALRGQPLLLRAIEAVLLGDLLAYWEHRMSHRVGWIWRFHRVHHIGGEIDFLSRFRYHPVDYAPYVLAQVAPLYLLGVPLWLVPIMVTVIYHVGTLAHANVRFSLGPLWWLLVTPAYHRWHHADGATRERNFAELFPIWDVLFGTACHAPIAGVGELGVDDNRPVAFADQWLAPFEEVKPAA